MQIFISAEILGKTPTVAYKIIKEKPRKTSVGSVLVFKRYKRFEESGDSRALGSKHTEQKRCRDAKFLLKQVAQRATIAHLRTSKYF